MSDMRNDFDAMNREAMQKAFEGQKFKVFSPFKCDITKNEDGNYVDDETIFAFAWFCRGLASQAQQPTDLSKQLREYAVDSGYSHNDYADTMLAAASEIERLTASQAQQNTKPFAYMQLVNNEPLRSVALFEREKRGMEDHINLTYPDLKVSWVELFTAPAQAELSSNPLQLELEPYAYDIPTKDGTELAYAIYYTKYNNPLPEGAIPLYVIPPAPEGDAK